MKAAKRYLFAMLLTLGLTGVLFMLYNWYIHAQ